MNAERMDMARMWAARFAYVADTGDRWTVPRDEPPYGDCEDLALGVAYILAGCQMARMLWMFATGRVELWTGDSLVSGERHAALWYKGAWIDTGAREWTTQPRLADAKRVSFVRLLRELGYLRQAALVFAVIAAASFAWALS